MPPPFKQWQIWNVDWVYQDTGEIELRPALLLSTPDYESPRVPNALLFAKITGERRVVPGMIDLIQGEDPEFPITRLTKTCYIYLSNQQELDRIREVHSYRGELGPNTIQLVIDEGRNLGLWE